MSGKGDGGEIETRSLVCSLSSSVGRRCASCSREMESSGLNFAARRFFQGDDSGEKLGSVVWPLSG